ncbi:hypothetical protein RI056_00830 [Komagataeibacter nataicola]|uniref:hypothetical protein n=1 Tax=Komagataeibacter nataicola TaxID=265960 RepID=UPI0028B04D3C|nr:hypothetical protein [Komagataeibacter nataicola]WNM08743.1 hypothetical protein RI056_00830 [Komagataeibacter nataicola]
MMGVILAHESAAFRPRLSIVQVEESTDLAPRFDAAGLLLWLPSVMQEFSDPY